MCSTWWYCRCAAVGNKTTAACGACTHTSRGVGGPAAAAISSFPVVRTPFLFMGPAHLPRGICGSRTTAPFSRPCSAPLQPGDLLYMPRGVSECLGRLALSRTHQSAGSVPPSMREAGMAQQHTLLCSLCCRAPCPAQPFCVQSTRRSRCPTATPCISLSPPTSSARGQVGAA